MLRFLVFIMACCLSPWPVLAQPKLIHFGWDNPTIETLPVVVPKLDASVFDGLSITSTGHDHVFSTVAATEDSYEHEAAILKSIKPGTLAHSYLVIHSATDGLFDWRNDRHWGASLSNMRNLVSLAKAGQLKGIVFDMEPYGKSPWDYRSQAAKDSLSFSACRELIFQRGKDMMSTMQTEYPGLDVFYLYGLSANTYLLNDPASLAEPDSVLAEDGYGLWSSFFGGMVKAADETTRLIDGNENAYYYTRSENFDASYKTIKQDLTRFLSKDVKIKYAERIKLGHAVYIDGVMNLHKSPRFIGYYFKSDQPRLELLSRNVANAMRSSESLVWIYAEKTLWWQEAPRKDIDRAIRAAKKDVQVTVALPISKALKEAESTLASRIAIAGTLKDKAGHGVRPEGFGSALNDAACYSWGDGQYACEFPKGSNFEIRPRLKGSTFEPAFRSFENVTETRYGVNWESH
jgi:hypothetical protein